MGCLGLSWTCLGPSLAAFGLSWGLFWAVLGRQDLQKSVVLGLRWPVFGACFGPSQAVRRFKGEGSSPGPVPNFVNPQCGVLKSDVFFSEATSERRFGRAMCKLRSDLATMPDGISTRTGYSLQCDSVLYLTRHACLACANLDFRAFAGKHDNEAYANNSIASLERYGVDAKQGYLRFARNVADGALSGPYSGTPVGEVIAKKLGMPRTYHALASSLDGLHAGEKAGQHADFGERVHDTGYVRAYFSVARFVRQKFGFGKGLSCAKTLAQIMNVPFKRQETPSTESTRVIVYESHRIARSYLDKVRLIALCLRYGAQAAVQAARAKAGSRAGLRTGLHCAEARRFREAGRKLLHLPTLLFLALRTEHRFACLWLYLKAAQRTCLSTMELERIQVRAVRRMVDYRAAAVALKGTVQVYALLLAFLSDTTPDGKQARERIPRDQRPSRHAVQAFVTQLAWKSAGREFPRSCKRCLEALFERTWQGLQVGCTLGAAHPFSEPLTQKEGEMHHGEAKGTALKRVLSQVSEAVERFCKWSADEVYFFRARVVFWDSKRPPGDLTGHGLEAGKGKGKGGNNQSHGTRQDEAAASHRDDVPFFWDDITVPEYSPDDLERRETEAFVDPGSALPDVLGCVGMGATSADSPANDVPHLWPLGEEDGDEPEAVDVDNDPEQIPLDSAEPADMLHSQSSESSDARCCVRNIVKEMRSLERGGQFSHTMIQKEAFRTERRGNVFFPPAKQQALLWQPRCL